MIRWFRMVVVLVLAGGCSFVFGDENYIDNDATIPFDTGVGEGGDGGDAGEGGPDGGDADAATGCLGDPTLCTDGTRCAADGRCVACDADGDGAFDSSATCDSVAMGAPRDCDDDDADVYPGAAPVCGDGKINGCEAGPASFRTALSVAEIGMIGEGSQAEIEDASSLAIEVAGPTVLIGRVRDGGSARIDEVDGQSLAESSMRTFATVGDVLGIDLRDDGTGATAIAFLARDGSGDAVLSYGAHSALAPIGAFTPGTYSFDDGPCVAPADAAALAGDLSIAAGAAHWLVSSGQLVRVTTGGSPVTTCVPLAGDHRSSGTDGSALGFVETATGVRRVASGASRVDVIDGSGPGEARTERPGYARIRFAARELVLSAWVDASGQTRLGPVECTAGGACVAGAAPVATFGPPAGVAETYGSALDGLVGDFAALVQIEERAAAPAPADRSHDVVVRLVEYPNVSVGSPAGGGPGEALVVHTHAYDSGDPNHSEVREVAVATARDGTGNLTIYWAALVGDRRLAPGATEDPDADNEVRYGGVRLCASE